MSTFWWYMHQHNYFSWTSRIFNITLWIGLNILTTQCVWWSIDLYINIRGKYIICEQAGIIILICVRLWIFHSTIWYHWHAAVNLDMNKSIINNVVPRFCGPTPLSIVTANGAQHWVIHGSLLEYIGLFYSH